MSILIELAPDEEARLAEMAVQRGIAVPEQAQEMLSDLLRQRASGQERTQMMMAAKKGDKTAWLALLEQAPPVAPYRSTENQPPQAMSREHLRREHIYEG